jgi:hypothetical protein
MLGDVASSADKAMDHLGCTNSLRDFGGFSGIGNGVVYFGEKGIYEGYYGVLEGFSRSLIRLGVLIAC